ncbi:MAG: hypothetical protein K2M98_00160, partial [Muribaculum sp.]|nr:hypothetical protein [Muribaculum sp.]
MAHTILYKTLTLWTAVLVGLLVYSCQDDPIYDPSVIPDGDVELTGEVAFRPLVEIVADQVSRSGETAMTGTVAPKDQALLAINKLTVLFFNTQRQLVRNISGPVSFTPGWEDRPSDNNIGEISAETSTPKATFKMTVPSGRYYMYAVANMDINLNDVPDIDALRSIKLSWVSNSIARNIEMLGVFTTGDAHQAKNIGFEEDKEIALVPGVASVHAWARRALSKVTIDFDGSQLRNNVSVF